MFSNEIVFLHNTIANRSAYWFSWLVHLSYAEVLQWNDPSRLFVLEIYKQVYEGD